MTADPSPAPMLVNVKTAARLLSISSRKLWSMTAGGELPCVRCGRLVRYDPADLRAWIEKNKGGKP